MTQPIDERPDSDGASNADTDAELHVKEGAGVQPAAPLAPGDEVPDGAPGAAEGICRSCGGKKVTDAGNTCPVCLGKGTVEVGVG